MHVEIVAEMESSGENPAPRSAGRSHDAFHPEIARGLSFKRDGEEACSSLLV